MQRFLATRRFLTLVLLLVASTIGLAGCGNKGPLFLPPEPVQQITSPTAVSEETEKQEESKRTEELEDTEQSETTQQY
ncbi:MAG: putative small lipoprotein YifL [Porticoccus sp.]|jgi:predicted small lipoprotein YifL